MYISGTYFPRLLENYVKVANQLETETTIVKQLQKETNLPQESDEALSRLNVLSTQQSLLEESWKPVRWLFDILSRFRNRGGGASSGITFANLNEWYSKQTDFPDDTVVFANPVTSSTSATNTNNEELLLVSLFFLLTLCKTIHGNFNFHDKIQGDPTNSG